MSDQALFFIFVYLYIYSLQSAPVEPSQPSMQLATEGCTTVVFCALSIETYVARFRNGDVDGI